MSWLLSKTSYHRRRQWHPTPVLLPGKSHGWRSLEGCSPWGRWGSDTTERLHFHFPLSLFTFIEEGNGNPLWCSCLENPKNGGAWWTAIYGVTQSWTRLKQLSSSNTYIGNLEKWYRWTYLQSGNRDTDIENGCMDSRGQGCGMNWEIGTDI